jgi:hypothetical protein
MTLSVNKGGLRYSIKVEFEVQSEKLSFEAHKSSITPENLRKLQLIQLLPFILS